MSVGEYNITVKDGKFYCGERDFLTFTEALSYRRNRELTGKGGNRYQ